jgi:hypothetical protein
VLGSRGSLLYAWHQDPPPWSAKYLFALPSLKRQRDLLGHPVLPPARADYTLFLPWWLLFAPWALLTAVVWRRTRRKPGRAFPIEPLFNDSMLQ